MDTHKLAPFATGNNYTNCIIFLTETCYEHWVNWKYQLSYMMWKNKLHKLFHEAILFQENVIKVLIEGRVGGEVRDKYFSSCWIGLHNL